MILCVFFKVNKVTYNLPKGMTYYFTIAWLSKINDKDLIYHHMSYCKKLRNTRKRAYKLDRNQTAFHKTTFLLLSVDVNQKGLMKGAFTSNIIFRIIQSKWLIARIKRTLCINGVWWKTWTIQPPLRDLAHVL